VALLVRIPWASRVWALPFLSALAYSERYAKEQGKRHKKKLTEWAELSSCLLLHDLGDRTLILAGSVFGEQVISRRARVPYEPVATMWRITDLACLQSGTLYNALKPLKHP